MSKFLSCVLIAACLLLALRSVQAAYPINPILVDDSIYVSQQGIYRFDRNQSEPLWSSLQGVETFEPVIHETLLLVGSTQGLYALELETGRIAWHIEKQHTLFTPSISTWHLPEVCTVLYTRSIPSVATSFGAVSFRGGFTHR